MVKLRLARFGAKKHAFYRLVATDSRSPRDGRFLETLGTYDPHGDPPKINFQMERVSYWLSKGAKPSLTVSQLVRRAAQPS